MKAKDLIIGELYESVKNDGRVVIAIGLNYRDVDCFVGKVVQDKNERKIGFRTNKFLLDKFKPVKVVPKPVFSKSGLSMETITKSAVLMTLTELFDSGIFEDPEHLIQYMKTNSFDDEIRGKIKLLKDL